ncbi:MAG: phospholipase D/Transphosphatidylase [Rhodospirillales bacterium]|nr:phospholipase D/Transphosphatidylase [Rhodospirillales bacterium]
MSYGEVQADVPGSDSPCEPVNEVLRPGSNCWRIEQADRAAILTNSDYFAMLATSLKQARRLIIINGWIFDPLLVLEPGLDGPEGRPLLQLFESLLAERPELEIRLLLWDRTIFYGGNGALPRKLAAVRRTVDRLDYRFVSPSLGASCHQKIVCIDDRIAFVGGIDLCSDRWDRKDHHVHEPRRVTATGERYGPIHDVQMIVEGRAAEAVAQMAKAHWRRASGEMLDRLPAIRPVWPHGLAPDFTDAPVAIARTDPFYPRHPRREIAALYRDILKTAQRTIYIEAQYLTADDIGEILVERLREPDPPEIVIVLNRVYAGFFEGLVMGANRDRLLHRLLSADSSGRLRVYYPIARAGQAVTEIKIHAKLVIVDDCLLRIGSSNLNNRSMGTDTECDLAIETRHPGHRAKIREIRARLIAEHTCRPVSDVMARLNETESLIAALDSLDADRLLRPLKPTRGAREVAPLAGTAVLDPIQPLTVRFVRPVVEPWLAAGRAIRRWISVNRKTVAPTANGIRK